MKILFRGVLAAAGLCALLAAPAYAGPTVTVRVEAPSGTLVPETRVTLGDATFEKVPGNPCAQTSRAGALELATAGDWAGAWHAQYGQQIDRIKTVNLPDNTQRFWSVWKNRRWAMDGNCDPVQQGDELLFVVGCASATTDCWSGNPLFLQAPATATPGEAFTATATTVVNNPDWSQGDGPAEGATVSGGGASATTGADGNASLTLTQRGTQTLTVTKAGSPPDSVQVCVTDGADGYCGTQTPAPVADRIAPKALLLGLVNARRYSRSQAPQLLRGKVEDSGGVLMVKLRLTRTSKGRCWAFSGRRERFIRRPAGKCGAVNGWWFKIGDRADWEYQLASKLGPGRYVLDVNAIDKAYNRDDARRRGENRVVFHVR